jgi:hypothetical protein
METTLLLIALRRANYARLRALRARRQAAERAWVEGWTEAFDAAMGGRQRPAADPRQCDLFAPHGPVGVPWGAE